MGTHSDLDTIVKLRADIRTKQLAWIDGDTTYHLFAQADVARWKNAARLLARVIPDAPRMPSTPPFPEPSSNHQDGLAAADAMLEWCKQALAPVTPPPPAAPGEPREPEIEKSAATGAPQAVPTAAGKGVAPRNGWFLEQWESHESLTYHKPAKIHATWNAMKLSAREAICPDNPKTVSRAVVSRGITRARHTRDGKPSKSSKKRKRAIRKT